MNPTTAPGDSLPLGALPRYDDAIALVEPGKREFSYRNLDDLATGICRHLVRQGIRRDQRVGICLRRSGHAIASILGILRCGATYVPLDPLAPTRRNADVLGECDANLCLTEVAADSGLRQALDSAGGHCKLESIDTVDTEREPRLATAAAVDPAIACVLYTSGSTGGPKGWMMTTAQVKAHTDWTREFFGITDSDVFASLSMLNFAMSVTDIFTSLRAGGTLAMVPDGARNRLPRLLDIIDNVGATVWFSAPILLKQLASIEPFEPRKLATLRRVMFGGEVFPPSELKKLVQRLPGPRYFHLYGSTEAAIAAHFEIPPEWDFQRPVPIGQPCSHYTMRVVDESGQPVRPGTAGELQINGVGLDAGYLNRPQLTRERIVCDHGGVCWFRTGDLARQSADGLLYYVGRAGRMIKLRGYRIEPSEVEYRLLAHPTISEAAVMLDDDPRGARLVAHVNGSELPMLEIKSFCSAVLPSYMVPERFVFHEKLPRNARGKIDFQALVAGSSAVDPASSMSEDYVGIDSLSKS